MCIRDRFKGYDGAWLDGDLPALTAWLGEVSTVHPTHPAGATDLASWRAGLRADDVFVTISSGTAGSRSLVPRDRMTLTALRSSSGVRLPWALAPGVYDALLLTPRGMGCLLYTSDAADERSSVDLGGRRIITKTKNN